MSTHNVSEIPRLTKRDLTRFSAKFYKDGKSGCWIWTSAADPHGYGRFSLLLESGKWRTFLAHRVSWFIHRESTGLFILHKCDNPRCINPDHLFSGTQKDNMSDCSKKGRAIGNRGLVVGEKHGMHKLTWDVVDEIRSSDLPQRKLAIIYGVHQTLVSLVQRRKIWKDELRHV